MKIMCYMNASVVRKSQFVEHIRGMRIAGVSLVLIEKKELVQSPLFPVLLIHQAK